MGNRTLSETLRTIRNTGLENAFQRFYSAYQGTITACDDPQARGRNKVHMKVLGYPAEHRQFAELISPYAGDDFGFFFPPYENDNVMVTFDQGDIHGPVITGSSWRTRDNKAPKQSGLPVEFVNTETNDEGEEIGAAPTVRGLKVKNGSALVFDETEDLTCVEMWTGETQGIGNRATKLHRVRLDSTKDAGQVVIATFGDEGGSGGPPSDMDTATVRDKKELESRLRHQILMRDTTTDRFVQIKSIGTDDTMQFLQVLLSDTEERIKITSSDQHYILVDDKNDNITVETMLKFRTIWDQLGKLILTETPGLQKFTMNDNDNSNTLETSMGQMLKQDAVGTVITEPLAAFNVTATTDSLHGYAASLTNTIGTTLTDTITGAWTVTANAMSITTQAALALIGNALTLTGQATIALGAPMVTITAPQVTIASAQVLAGSGNNLPLVNALGLAKYNAHGHVVVGPFPGFAIPVPSDPLTLVNTWFPGLDTTVTLLGA